MKLARSLDRYVLGKVDFVVLPLITVGAATPILFPLLMIHHYSDALITVRAGPSKLVLLLVEAAFFALLTFLGRRVLARFKVLCFFWLFAVGLGLFNFNDNYENAYKRVVASQADNRFTEAVAITHLSVENNRGRSIYFAHINPNNVLLMDPRVNITNDLFADVIRLQPGLRSGTSSVFSPAHCSINVVVERAGFAELVTVPFGGYSPLALSHCGSIKSEEKPDRLPSN